jgi:hypothetical protein
MTAGQRQDGYRESLPRIKINAGTVLPLLPGARINSRIEEDTMAARSPEARKVLRDLDKALASASARQGQKLVWTPQEASILVQIETILDRKHDFLAAYEVADDVKVRLKISGVILSLELASVRLMAKVKTELAAPESRTTLKARQAAVRRWDRDRNAGA